MDKKSHKRRIGSQAVVPRARPDVAATLNHPIRRGETVMIYRIVLLSRPFFEGRATVLCPIEHTADLYRVRFENERRVHRRLVHPGDWQNKPDRLLTALTAHWGAGESLDLFAEFSPYGDGPD